MTVPAQRAASDTLATPTGVLIYDGAPHTDAWFEARRTGITATDVASIVAPSEYGNALSVWLDKTGNPLPDEAGEAAYWGTVLEDPVATRWAEVNASMVEPVGILANQRDRWMIASLDRLVHTCPEGRRKCALEVKTRSAFTEGQWRADVPDDVLAQVHWQMIVSGFDHVHVAVLIGGQRMQCHTVDRDDDLAHYLIDEATKLWGCVQSGFMPDVDPNAFAVKCLNHMWPVRDGQVELAEDEARELIDAYETARHAATAAEADKQRERARIIGTLGPSAALFVDGRPAVTYKADSRGVRTLRIAKRYQMEAAP